MPMRILVTMAGVEWKLQKVYKMIPLKNKKNKVKKPQLITHISHVVGTTQQTI